MTDLECPFHKGLATIPRNDLGSLGLDYRALMERALKSGWEGVMDELDRTEQRALASAPVCEIFWEEFSRIRGELEWGDMWKNVEGGAQKYDALLGSVSNLLSRALLKIDEMDSEARERLETCLSQNKVKGIKIDFAKKHLHRELMGALEAMSGFCELIEKVHQKKFGTPVSMEEFKNTLLSKEFVSIFVVLGVFSEDDGVTMLKEISSEGYSMVGYDPKKFDLIKVETGSYFILCVSHDFGEKIRQLCKDKFNTNGDKRVKCPAGSLKVEKFGTEGYTTMLKQMVVWFLEQVLKMKSFDIPKEL